MDDRLFKRIGKECRKQTENLYPEELCSVSGFALGKVVGFKRGFYKGAEYALSHQWISVDEALPEYGEDVLVRDDCGRICFSHRSDNPEVKTHGNGWCHYNSGKVIAWMPVPKYRKEERQ